MTEEKKKTAPKKPKLKTSGATIDLEEVKQREEEQKQEKNTKKMSKAVMDAMTAIEKSYGKGAVMRMGDKERVPCEVIPSGSFKVNRALKVGGYPRGRIVEIFGPESSGKTTLTLHAIAEAQKMGGDCLFIDAEHALDVSYAENLGVNVDDLFMCQPDYGEQGLEILSKLIESGGFMLAVVDSVEALVPKTELDGEFGDSHMGLKARMMNAALRRLAGVASRNNTTIIFINQLRLKIGVMFGNPETTPGGKGLGYWSSVRIDIRKSTAIKDTAGKGAGVTGNLTRIKVIKNKMAPPHGSAEVDIIFGRGICSVREVFDLSLEYEIIQKRAASYDFPGDDGVVTVVGRENAIGYLEENKAMMASLELLLHEAIKD